MEKIKKIIAAMGTSFASNERETSILFDHGSDVVYLETTEPYTARRWYTMFSKDKNVKFDDRADSLKITIPTDYCRKPELMVKSKHRPR